MDTDERIDTRLYRAIINIVTEGYALAPADQVLPAEWKDAGKAGSKEEVMGWIDVIWPEYARRPLSLRRKMEEQGYVDTRVYQLLIDEGAGRYYPYPREKGIPPGFSSAGVSGSQSEMIDWAEQYVRRDMTEAPQ
ncbi:MAG TPA: hypothetical protein VFX02_02830 [Gammaproteobacteria bacterium]|nr:hypothetical protein [Gammaproteobacteria bacterium]